MKFIMSQERVNKNRQYLLKPEVEIIVKHLGEPY